MFWQDKVVREVESDVNSLAYNRTAMDGILLIMMYAK